MAIHPNVRKFIADFERESIISGSFRNKLGHAEIRFLEAVWGPAFQFNYDGLKAEYPFKDFKGGQRYADFAYARRGMKLVIEIDGFSSHARDLAPGEFDDHLMRQNDLVLAGWLLLRFSARQIERVPTVCQRQLKQAIGHLWSTIYNRNAAAGADRWQVRKQEVIQLAQLWDGMITPTHLAEAIGIGPRTAASWLRRFSTEGLLTPASGSSRITKYKLT